MSQKTILVIEDDAAVRRGIVDAVGFAGYAVHEAATGDDGLTMGIKVDCDLILLDLVLPGVDGLEILREVRRVRPALPVIILTARGEEGDRVRGLELGADDYVVKPFSVRELLARIEAVLRRSAERPSDVQSIEWAGGRADLARHRIVLDDESQAELSEHEGELLRYLALNRGRAISREELLARVWRINPRAIVETRMVDMSVARLREKLGDDSQQPRVILTVRGKGYMLAEEGKAINRQSPQYPQRYR